MNSQRSGRDVGGVGPVLLAAWSRGWSSARIASRRAGGALGGPLKTPEVPPGAARRQSASDM